MRRHKLWLGAAAVIIAAVILAFSWHYQPAAVVEAQKVTVGINTSPDMALVLVAQDKGFFKAHNLAVEIKEFTAGKFALEAFLGGSLDFSISADVPPLLAALQGNKFVVPAQVVRQTKNEVRVVAKKDANSASAMQYFKVAKRKLATSAGGGPEFFTYEFLNKLGISSKDVEIVNQKPADMPAALVGGSVDAITDFDPYAFIAEQQMGDKSVTFTDASIYSELYVIEAKENVRQNPVTLKNFLSALVDAENYLKTHPEESKAIVMAHTKLDKTTIDGIWGNTDFGVALTPQLLEYWNREVDWAKATGKIKTDAVVPNLKDYIFDGPLKEINPSAVTM